MGGLRKYMKITWITSLVGSLALIGTPFLSGFYSKDSIIEAVHFSKIAGSGFAYFAVLTGVFVTAFYSFRMYFLVFHGKERFGDSQHDSHHGDHHHGGTPHESPWVVTLPLIALAIPSLVIGFIAITPLEFGGFFGDAIKIGPEHKAMEEMAKEFHGPLAMAMHGLTSLPFWLALGGVVLSWFFYLKRPDIPAKIKSTFSAVHRLLENKYGFDTFNDWFFAGGARGLGKGLWRAGDVGVIDGILVNGTAKLVGWMASWVRRYQTGFIYHYAFTMIIGVFGFLTLFWFHYLKN